MSWLCIRFLDLPVNCVVLATDFSILLPFMKASRGDLTLSHSLLEFQLAIKSIQIVII